jgi:hypothetical protein
MEGKEKGKELWKGKLLGSALQRCIDIIEIK